MERFFFGKDFFFFFWVNVSDHGLWVAARVDTRLSRQDHEVDILGLPALFIVFAGTYLGAVLRLAVGVLEAPVAMLEVASLRVLLLGRAVQLSVLVVQPVGRDALAGPADRVNDLTGQACGAVVVRKAHRVLKNVVTELVQFFIIMIVAIGPSVGLVSQLLGVRPEEVASSLQRLLEVPVECASPLVASLDGLLLAPGKSDGGQDSPGAEYSRHYKLNYYKHGISFH